MPRRSEPPEDDALDIPQEVRTRISTFSGIPINEDHGPKTLLENLGMKHPACVSLARSLNTFVKRRNEDGRVRVADIEDDEATVDSTIELVEKQIGTQE